MAEERLLSGEVAVQDRIKVTPAEDKAEWREPLWTPCGFADEHIRRVFALIDEKIRVKPRSQLTKSTLVLGDGRDGGVWGRVLRLDKHELLAIRMHVDKGSVWIDVRAEVLGLKELYYERTDVCEIAEFDEQSAAKWLESRAGEALKFIRKNELAELQW